MNKILAYRELVGRDEFLEEIKKHQEADNFIQGEYWDEKQQKGCAIGCSLESVARIKNIVISFRDHSKLPETLGWPQWIGRVEDAIFEGLRVERSKVWPVEFASAIQEGVDLDLAKAPFMVYVLTNTLNNFDNDKFPDITKSINIIVNLWKNQGTEKEFEEARLAAESAQSAVWSAESAVWSAESAVWLAAESAESAIWSAVRSAAESAQSATWSAVRSAAWSAQSATWSTARSAAYEYYADKLLMIIKGLKAE